MATRVNRKNAPTLPKEVVTTEKTPTKKEPAEPLPKSSGTAKPIGKRLAPKPKKLVKKTIGVKLKAKVQKLRFNPLAKAALQNAPKKKLIKNGVKEVKPRKRKIQVKKEPEDSPPVLEPIFPLDDNLLTKKKPKRVVKKNKNEAPELTDSSKIKQENEDELSLSSDDIPILPKQVKKTRAIKKPKVENETLEDVMNDLTFLIKSEDIKKEADTLSESGKSDTTNKPKKLTKKQKIDFLKKKMIKKENLENTLTKLDSSEEKIIDMLDLNVKMLKKKSPITNRRHSIEKCPIGPAESPSDNINVFSHLPRSISPRAKRKGKQDASSRKSSPYSTRSDSPARILRNGKQRKLKDLGLLEGLDLEIKKRRRLCSDSGSKLSGNESDSSFSDLASSHGTESNEGIDKTASNGPIDNLGLIDTFSTEESMPDKNVLLNIMKQTFNEVDLKKSNKFKVATVVTSKFYGRRNTGTPQGKSETILKEKIADEAPVMEDELELNITSAVQQVIDNLAEKTEEFDEDTLMLTENLQILSDKPQTFEPIAIPEQVANVPKEVAEVQEDSNVPEDIAEVQEGAKVPEDIAEEKVAKFQDDINVPEEIAEVQEEANVSDITEVQKDAIIQEEGTNVQEVTNVQEEVTNVQEEVTDVQEEVTNIQKELANIQEEFNNIEEIVTIQKEVEAVKNEIISEPMDCDDTIPLIPEETLTEIEKPEASIEDIVPKSIKEINKVEETVDTDQTEETEVPVCDDGVINESESIPMEVEQICEANLTENAIAVIENEEEDLNPHAEESEEKIAEKESILKALGLQRAQLAEESKQKAKEKLGDNYTGTLKTVIKINRDKKKPGRSSVKTSLHKSKTKSNTSTEDEQVVVEETTDKAPPPSWKQGPQSSDTAGANRKTHYSNRSNMDGSSEHTSDGEAPPQDGTIKALVIPEKASSFSIHPGRLCKDECSYCFGKFGLFDTPCHIAQMKSVDRQNKILATEKHLTRDSCLCDACYRHVDRKSNTPSYMNKSLKRNSLVAPGPRQNHCHVLGCSKESSNILRRKWIIKMRKSICQVINLDLDNPGLHSIPICEEHYSALEHLMICAMCRRRLARNHIHYLGPETIDLNNALKDNGIPLSLNDKPVVCKLCKCFASIILKDPEERPETSNNFFVEYKRRLLHFNDIVPMDESAAEEPLSVPSKAERIDIMKIKKKFVKNPAAMMNLSESELHSPEQREERVPSTDTNSQPQSRSESPSDDYNGVDYTTLIPTIAMDVGSDSESKKDVKMPMIFKKLNDMQREGVEIVKVTKNEKPKSESFKKFSYGPSVSVRQLFSGEEDLPLIGNIEFDNVKEKTPEGWEKCSTTIQYDEETKRLWQELQKPYGNQSSFLRHLVLLEKYFRNGDLVLSPRASHHSINYSESVHNRLKAYDNIPSSAGNIQPLSMLPFNKMHVKSSSGIITSGIIHTAINNSISTHPPLSTTITNSKPVGTTAMSVTSLPKSTPLTISQLNSPPLLPANAMLQPIRPKLVGQPPGLISLHPGTIRPIAPLVKVSQPQKIKFPITKNWRPNLIPIDPTKKQERKTGLVQVISGGRPYHITLEDYKKMCAIKRSFEMKQKRLQEAQAPKPILVTHNSVLKSIIPRKGLVISKTATVTAPATKIESDGASEGENILEKLDKQVEKLESKLNEKPSLLLPRIPKSLTVIPQTVTKKQDRPSSPVLLITPKSGSKS